MNLLSREDYQAIAEQLTLPNHAFIDGAFRPSKSGDTFASKNPATGEVLTELSACEAADVDYAVNKAREAFEQGHWSNLHPSERKAILIKLAKLIKRHRHELAVMESLDSGKPIADCELIDVPETRNTILWHAELIDKLYDQAAPAQPDALTMILREPVGVVGCVLPWNFPLLMLAWKIAPALASGNAVIVKPAEQTSLTALRVAELAHQAGVPRGILQVLTGFGPQVGEPLGKHPDVDMLTFTGSTETGKRFLRYAADSNMKKVVLECGGKNAAIVLNDAENLDAIAHHITQGAFWNMGENCSAYSRLIVQSEIKPRLMEKIVSRLKEWKTGDPLDPSNHLGALIDADHFNKVSSYLDSDQIIAGGETQASRYIQPTIIDTVAPKSRWGQEEIFGPILSVITVESISQAIAIANDTPYGLTASVYSANGKTALRVARAIKAGTVTVNCYGEGDVTTPFGGYKQSGFGGRDKGIQAHDQYTEIKTLWIDLSDDALDESIDD